MGRGGHFLVVVWDGGGNVLPAAGLTAALVDHGHDVRVLGPPSLRSRFERIGARFRTFRRAEPPPEKEMEAADDNPIGLTRFTSGRRLADDVLEELQSEPTDVAVVDAFLSAGLAAAEKAGVPAVALVHVLYRDCVEGPLATLWDPTRPMVDSTRRRLDIPFLDPDRPLYAALWDRCSLVLACAPERFDSPSDHRAANARYVGPMFDGPAAPPSEPGTGRVLVSFSTTAMGQRDPIQRTLDALAGLDVKAICTLGGVPVDGLTPAANTSVVDWVPHREVLPHTDVVVTHAGLGTVMAALASGVPMICMPLGRDQPVNAARVADLGLGIRLPSDAQSGVIRSALETVLGDESFTGRAQTMAEAIATYGNGAVAVEELEALL